MEHRRLRRGDGLRGLRSSTSFCDASAERTLAPITDISRDQAALCIQVIFRNTFALEPPSLLCPVRSCDSIHTRAAIPTERAGAPPSRELALYSENESLLVWERCLVLGSGTRRTPERSTVCTVRESTPADELTRVRVVDSERAGGARHTGARGLNGNLTIRRREL